MSATLGRQIGEKLLRVSIAVIGLLILRLILSALPMLKSPVIYIPSAATLSMPSVQNFFTSGQIADWQRVCSGVVPQTLVGNLSEVASDCLMQMHFAIFPLTIAYAVVDTLIFVVLVLFGGNLASIVRSNYAKFPDLGQILNFGILTGVVAAAYYSYQGILYPFLWPTHQDLYGWAFLVLGLAPLAGVVVLVSRNMDRITGAVLQSGTRALEGPAAIRCGSCGQSLASGTKFCPECGGSAVSAITAASGSGNKFCPSCGTANPSGTKFCAGCGQPILV